MSIAAKVAHVRAELASGAPTDHHCHWPDCAERVAPAAWGCKKHWFKLPKPIRDAIWRSYRAGQEATKTPSRDYVVAAREAQTWIAANYPRSARLL